MEEALWGMDYVMKTRLGDGYRAQTWGTNLWTDGKVGTDVMPVAANCLSITELWRISCLQELKRMPP